MLDRWKKKDVQANLYHEDGEIWELRIYLNIYEIMLAFTALYPGFYTGFI